MDYKVLNQDRLDSFISINSNIPKNQAKNLIDNDLVTVNGVTKSKCGTKVKEGDIVSYDLIDEEPLTVVPTNIALDILYEDDDLAIINKPKGMVVHPADSYRKQDTLVNALLYNFKSLSDINGDFRPGIVHRLDKDTSGLLIIAKNNKCHELLSEMIKNREITRIYYGLCDGNFKEDSGTIDAPIARSKRDRKKMGIVADGREAITKYKVVERFGKYTLVEFQLITGRTHQIRVHSKYIHHPIVGDNTYGGSQVLYKQGQLLHAKIVKFKHPITGEELSFESELPDYFNSVLEKLRKLNH